MQGRGSVFASWCWVSGCSGSVALPLPSVPAHSAKGRSDSEPLGRPYPRRRERLVAGLPLERGSGRWAQAWQRLFLGCACVHR